MTIDNWLTFAGTVLTFVGLLFVAWQMRDGNRQGKIQSQVRLYDMTRKLVSLGFSHPQLFAVLKGGAVVDGPAEQHYLQLWLNHFALIHSFTEDGAFQKDVQESLWTDFRAMIPTPGMRRQWQRFGTHYPASFQKVVNDLLHEAGRERADQDAGSVMN